MKIECMIIEVKIRLMMLFIFFFFFFCQCYRTRVSVDRFSHVPFFSHFYPKMDVNVHFIFVFLNIGRFNRKTKNTEIFHYKNKTVYNFYTFTVKTDFWNWSESRKFRRKNRENCLKVPTLLPLFQKNHCIY